MRERTPQREARIRTVLARRQSGLAVVMENIHDMHNISAIMRTCDATGVGLLCLLYNTEEFPDFTKHGKKSSAGARKWIRRRHYSTVEECYGALRAEGFRLYASALAGQSVSLFDLSLSEKTALVFGNENRGVSDEAREKADGSFLIPMVGMVQSLNVSVAAAVSLYEAFRQRKTAGLYESPQLSGKEIERQAKSWLEK